MKLVDSKEVSWEVISNHRETTIEFKRLLQGQPNTPENFELSLIRMAGVYTTPPHHHNFEQVRYALKGPMGYGPGRAQPEGSVGYFPEGSFYAQDVEEGQVTLLLQCGGASGSGFLSYDQLRAGAKELSEEGRFEDGRYLGRPGDNRPPKDGYEAVWEHVRGAPVAYPRPRYEDHTIMLPEGYLWRRTDVDGIARKHLATLTERELSLSFLRIDPGKSRDIGPVLHRTLLYVTEGSAVFDGRRIGPGFAIDLLAGETARLDVTERLVTFAMVLPEVPPLAEDEKDEEARAVA